MSLIVIIKLEIIFFINSVFCIFYFSIKLVSGIGYVW